jgi:hypothetical protein
MTHAFRSFAVILPLLSAIAGCFEDLRLAPTDDASASLSDAGPTDQRGLSDDVLADSAGSYGGLGGASPDAPLVDGPTANPDVGPSPGDCSPDQRRCGANQTPEICDRAGRWAPAAQPCPKACVGEGVCGGECPPGARDCGGLQKLTPRVCDQGGMWMDAGPACPKTCSAGLCGGHCKLSDRKCIDATTPASCDGAGNWIAQAACAFVCSGQGQCSGECVPGSGTCSGTVHSTCSATGTWQPDGSPQCKAKNGDSCASNVDCQTGFCVSGICCNSACAGTCVSCAMADTGRSNGTCAPISDGRAPPPGQCAQTAQSTCGDDGKCDGSGHCRQWGTAISCGTSGCDSSGKLVPTGKCDGNGSCDHGQAAACPFNLTCKADMCPSSCGGDRDCVAGYFCDKGTCSPRCLVSSGNLVPDGGFDRPAGWPGAESARWTSDDAFGCSTSGSERIEDSGTATSLCFATTPNTGYSFGARIKAESAYAARCSISWFPDGNCEFASVIGSSPLDFTQTSGEWESLNRFVLSPADARWANVDCNGLPGGGGFQVDMVFLKPGSGGHF